MGYAKIWIYRGNKKEQVLDNLAEKMDKCPAVELGVLLYPPKKKRERVMIKIWIKKMIAHGTSNYNVPVGVTNCKVLSSWSMSMTSFSLALNFDLVKFATHFLKLQIFILSKKEKMHLWGIMKI